MSRVLVVDDDRFLNRSLEEMFRKVGFSVATAFDGSDAIKKVGSFKPHLIVLDVMMPGENGYRVSRLVKSFPRQGGFPKVLLLTSRRLDGEAEREDGMMSFSKADAIIYKPFQIEDLLATVHRLLAR